MLKKLLKIEFRSISRTLLPLMSGVLLLCLVTRLLKLASDTYSFCNDNPLFRILLSLTSVVTALGLAAAAIVCVILCLSRFYRMLGQEGYLMLTLPVTMTQQIASKLIAALCSSAVTLVFLQLCGRVVTGSDINLNFEFGLPSVQALPAMLMLFVILLLVAAGWFLFAYLCIAIGSHWSQQRLVGSILVYIVLSFILQIAAIAVVILLAFFSIKSSLIPVFNTWVADQPTLALYLILGVCLLICAAIDAILWAVTQYLLTHKLNLP